MEKLIEFKKFVDEITTENSRNYKISILEKYKENNTIKALLKFVFDPYIITGISKKKFDRDVSAITIPTTPNSLDDVISYLSSFNSGRDVDLAYIQAFNSKIADPELKELYRRIITKDLTIGVDSLTINKCIPQLISTFNVQLANKYFEKPEYVEGKDFALTTKIDGCRIIAIKENGQVHFYTRAGQLYENLVDLEYEMLNFMPDNICLDGEITLLDKGNLTSKDQYKETTKIVRKDGEKHGVKMLVFDCMSAEQFRTQCCPTPYLERRHQLNSIFDYNKEMKAKANINTSYFVELPILYIGHDINNIHSLLTYNVEHGEEGIMINILNAPYQFKRTNDLLKCKLFNSCDLQVIELEEGTGKNSGKLGAFICEYKGNKVRVGSGLSDTIRDQVWADKDNYLGRIIEVSYFEETHNQQGGLSLRFPVFKDFRFDKSEPNY